jgi:hypothetical protein
LEARQSSGIIETDHTFKRPPSGTVETHHTFK